MSEEALTPEQRLERLEKLVESNARTMTKITAGLDELRRDRQAVYQLLSELVRDRALMYEILSELNQNRQDFQEKLSRATDSLAKIAERSCLEPE